MLLSMITILMQRYFQNQILPLTGKEHLRFWRRKDTELYQKMILYLQAVTMRLQVQVMEFQEKTVSELPMVLIPLYQEKMEFTQKIQMTVMRGLFTWQEELLILLHSRMELAQAHGCRQKTELILF